MILLLALSTALAQSCPVDGEPPWDLNCNGIGKYEEGLVDLEDPDCGAAVEAHGEPARYLDSYFDPAEHGCAVPLLHGDRDHDGRVATTVRIEYAPGEIWEITLTCDNCPRDHNPDQADANCDGVGDACTPCLEGGSPPAGSAECTPTWLEGSGPVACSTTRAPTGPWGLALGAMLLYGWRRQGWLVDTATTPARAVDRPSPNP